MTRVVKAWVVMRGSSQVSRLFCEWEKPELDELMETRYSSPEYTVEQVKVVSETTKGAFGGKEPRSPLESLLRQGMLSAHIGNYTELAKAVGAGRVLVQQWMNGSKPVAGNYVEKLSKLLKLQAAVIREAADVTREQYKRSREHTGG